jgi:DNA repair protein RecN (Recombination protein N)
MRSLGSIDQNTAELSDKLAGIQANTHELLRDLRIYIDNLSFDPDEAKDINRKYDGYYDILRKYGPSIEDARDFYLKTKGRYDFLNNLEHNDEELKEKLAAIIKDLGREAQKITAERKKISAALKKTIEGELKELGMPHIQFECRVEKTEFNTDGQDSVTFFISPNAGEGLKPLSEIVSSGEAARVMLALKKALVKVDPIPVLIFDEIDAQIGGRLGTITGQKLRDLSKNRQVILITHLPQIASFADLHFKITKKVENNRTSTAIELLTKDTRIKELAKMMSGEKESAISVAHANDMLQKAQVI